jgi:hypothetical protein
MDIWTQLLKPMIKWMNSDSNPVFVKAGIDIFSQIFEYGDDRVHVLVPFIMPVLYEQFTKATATEEIRLKIMILLLLCF